MCVTVSTSCAQEQAGETSKLRRKGREAGNFLKEKKNSNPKALFCLLIIHWSKEKES
jgi:hypothetical protein